MPKKRNGRSKKFRKNSSERYSNEPSTSRFADGDRASTAPKTSKNFDIPGFYFDKETKRYYKIAPCYSGNKVTKESIAKKEAEEKRKNDVETLFHKKPTVKTQTKETKRKICIRNIVPLLNQIKTQELRYGQLKSHNLLSTIKSLKPIGSQTLFQTNSPVSCGNIEHIHMMLIGKDFNEMIGVWTFKDSLIQRIQRAKLKVDVKTNGSISNPVIAEVLPKKIQSMNKVTDICWTSVDVNDHKHFLYTTVCQCGIANSLAVIRSMEGEEGDENSSADIQFSLGKKATWACAWNSARKVFSVGSERQALVLNAETRAMWEYNTNKSDPLVQIFSQQGGNILYSGTRKGQIVSHDMRRNPYNPVGCLSQKSGVCSLQTLYNDTTLLAADFTGKICLWDTRKQSVIQEYEGNKNLYSKLPVHVDESQRVIYTVGDDGYTRFWDLQLGSLLYSLPPPIPVSRDMLPSVRLSQRWGNQNCETSLLMALSNKLYFYGNLRFT